MLSLVKVRQCARLALAAVVVSHPMTTASSARLTTMPTDDAPLLSGTLSFVGHATVGDFVGSTSSVSGAITRDGPAPQGWVEARVATLATGNARRDRDMRASLEANRYPTMRLDVLGGRAASALVRRDDAQSLLVHGDLTIHGVTRAVDLPVTVTRAADTIHVSSEFPLDLADYHIGGLTRMLGLLQMRRRIEVRVDLRFVSGRAIP